jgi:CHASE2 domain-containing sensor protein
MLKKGWFWIDSVLCTGFIVFFLVFVLELFAFIDVLDPIGDAIGEVAIGDIVFSQLREDPPVNEDIVMVNLGLLPRDGLAEQIKILNKYNPKVIGIDALFFSEKEPEVDSTLMAAFAEVKNLVLPGKLNYNEEEDHFEIKRPVEKFNQYAHSAFVNLTSDAETQESFKVCKSFIPKAKVSEGIEEVAFGVKLVEFLDKEKFDQFIKRKNEFEVINWRGNAGYNFNSNYNNQFYILDFDQVLNEDFVPEMIENKIIIMGYLGDRVGHNAWEDKFFTPLNTKYAGRANPDMYGAVIHANIAAMIISGDFINEISDNWEKFIMILVLFLNIIMFSWMYQRLPTWYDGLSKIVQFFEVLILLGVAVIVFDFGYQLELGITIGAVLLSGDLLELYFGIIKNLFTAEGRRSLFKKELVN